MLHKQTRVQRENMLALVLLQMYRRVPYSWAVWQTAGRRAIFPPAIWSANVCHYCSTLQYLFPRLVPIVCQTAQEYGCTRWYSDEIRNMSKTASSLWYTKCYQKVKQKVSLLLWWKYLFLKLWRTKRNISKKSGVCENRCNYKIKRKKVFLLNLDCQNYSLPQEKA